MVFVYFTEHNIFQVCSCCHQVGPPLCCRMNAIHTQAVDFLSSVLLNYLSVSNIFFIDSLVFRNGFTTFHFQIFSFGLELVVNSRKCSLKTVDVFVLILTLMKCFYFKYDTTIFGLTLLLFI